MMERTIKVMEQAVPNTGLLNKGGGACLLDSYTVQEVGTKTLFVHSMIL